MGAESSGCASRRQPSSSAAPRSSDPNAPCEAGQLLYRGTLEAGQVIRFARPKLFVIMGRPGNVRMRLNGRVVQVPNRGSPTAVIVTPRGLTPTSAAA